MSFYRFGVEGFFANSHWIAFGHSHDHSPLILMDDVPLLKCNGESMVSAFRRFQDQGKPLYVEAPLVQFGPRKPSSFPRAPARMGGRCHVEVRRYDSWDFEITGIRTKLGERINVDFMFSYDGEPEVNGLGGPDLWDSIPRRVYLSDDLAEAVDGLFGQPKPKPKPKTALHVPGSRWSGVI